MTWLAAISCLALLASQEVAPQRGHPAAPINWRDESGRTRNLAEFAGYPLVLLPMYTRCPSACLQTVSQLKRALGQSSADPREFRVLLFSFDPADTPSSLVAYRRREAIPLSWSVGASDQENIDKLLDSIGFQVAAAGTEFMHPNTLLFLDQRLRVAKWIYGTNYSARDIDNALRVARGESDWLSRYSQVLYAIALFLAALLCVALVQQLVSRRAAASDVSPARQQSA